MHSFGIMMGHLCGIGTSGIMLCLLESKPSWTTTLFGHFRTRVGHATYRVLQYLGFTNCEHLPETYSGHLPNTLSTSPNKVCFYYLLSLNRHGLESLFFTFYFPLSSQEWPKCFSTILLVLVYLVNNL